MIGLKSIIIIHSNHTKKHVEGITVSNNKNSKQQWQQYILNRQRNPLGITASQRGETELLVLRKQIICLLPHPSLVALYITKILRHGLSCQLRLGLLYMPMALANSARLLYWPLITYHRPLQSYRHPKYSMFLTFTVLIRICY